MGQRTDRDHIGAGGREARQRLERDPAGNLRPGTTGNLGNRRGDTIGCHIVQKQDLRTRGKRLLDLVDAGDLALDASQMGGAQTTSLDGGRKSACRGDMVVLDEDMLPETGAMVVASAAAHRGLFERAPTRCCFSGVDDPHSGPCNSRSIAGALRGDAAQALEKIQEGALGAQDGPGPALDTRKFLARPTTISVVHRGKKAGIRIHLLEHPFCDLDPADDQILLGLQVGRATVILGEDRFAGKIAQGDVLLESQIDQPVGRGGDHETIELDPPPVATKA